MSYKRRYRKGTLITTIGELAEQELIHHGCKILHRGWFMAWQMAFAQRMIQIKALYRAEPIDVSREENLV